MKDNTYIRPPVKPMKDEPYVTAESEPLPAAVKPDASLFTEQSHIEYMRIYAELKEKVPNPTFRAMSIADDIRWGRGTEGYRRAVHYGMVQEWMTAKDALARCKPDNVDAFTQGWYACSVEDPRSSERKADAQEYAELFGKARHDINNLLMGRDPLTWGPYLETAQSLYEAMMKLTDQVNNG